MTQPPDPSWQGLLFALVPAAGCMVLLAWLRLGQVRTWTIAVLRMSAQLAMLAVVLRWVFDHQSGGLVVAIGLGMLLASAHTVGARQGGPVWTLRLEAFSAMALALVAVMFVTVRLSLRLEPWYSAPTVIPVLGMVLGNSVSGVSLAADRLESELRAERDRVELRLALGATARQAAHPALRAAVHSALTPILNNMMIAGIVAIPGMSTGQILAGADVGTALRYQVLIYLAISATVGLSTLMLLAIRLRRYFTPAHQLRHDRLGASR